MAPPPPPDKKKPARKPKKPASNITTPRTTKRTRTKAPLSSIQPSTDKQSPPTEPPAQTAPAPDPAQHEDMFRYWATLDEYVHNADWDAILADVNAGKYSGGDQSTRSERAVPSMTSNDHPPIMDMNANQQQQQQQNRNPTPRRSNKRDARRASTASYVQSSPNASSSSSPDVSRRDCPTNGGGGGGGGPIPRRSLRSSRALIDTAITSTAGHSAAPTGGVGPETSPTRADTEAGYFQAWLAMVRATQG